jgi:tRNA pseudouridine55 synthase
MSRNSDLFGVLNVNKPAGMTSRDLVNRVQRLVRPVKVGHAGTLDPMATGVLLICLGPATRLVTMLQEGSKTYVTQFTLGQSSDTDDSTGTVQRHEVNGPLPTLDEIVIALQTMTGVISQVPPDYSAVHVSGQRAYAMARAGQELSLKAKEVEIHSIQVIDYKWPHLELEITCGSGTYIRSIARDLGLQLGCGGLMSRLERTRVADFAVSESVNADDLSLDTINTQLCPAIRIVSQLPKYDCNEQDVFDILRGRRIGCRQDSMRPADAFTINQTIALTGNQFQDLLALATVTPDQTLQPRTVFLPAPS